MFEDCKRINPLPFDFAVFDNDKQLEFLIEYDGEQHFEEVFPVSNHSGLEYVQENDAIKNKYCQNNNIKLLRIPYTEFYNINEILDETMTIMSEA